MTTTQKRDQLKSVFISCAMQSGSVAYTISELDSIKSYIGDIDGDRSQIVPYIRNVLRLISEYMTRDIFDTFVGLCDMYVTEPNRYVLSRIYNVRLLFGRKPKKTSSGYDMNGFSEWLLLLLFTIMSTCDYDDIVEYTTNNAAGQEPNDLICDIVLDRIANTYKYIAEPLQIA